MCNELQSSAGIITCSKKVSHNLFDFHAPLPENQMGLIVPIAVCQMKVDESVAQDTSIVHWIFSHNKRNYHIAHAEEQGRRDAVKHVSKFFWMRTGI